MLAPPHKVPLTSQNTVPHCSHWRTNEVYLQNIEGVPREARVRVTPQTVTSGSLHQHGQWFPHSHADGVPPPSASLSLHT